MYRFPKSIFLISGWLLFVVIWSQKVFAQEDKLLQYMTEELNYEFENLQSEMHPPYYIDYRVNDVQSYYISSSFGCVTGEDSAHYRLLTCNVRVGSYEFDNTHPTQDYSAQTRYGFYGYNFILPIEEEKTAVKKQLWLATNEEFEYASDAYSDLVIKQLSKMKEENQSNDYSHEPAETYFEAPLVDFFTTIDKHEWRNRVEAYSGVFQDLENILSAEAAFSLSYDRSRFVSTEGSRIAQNRTEVQLMIQAVIRADDGMTLPLYKSYFSHTVDGMPTDEKVRKDLVAMKDQLLKLREAPVVGPYEGPAILSAGSAGVFFHEIFGHRVEGQRLKQKEDGQTFKNKIGKEVLPTDISVVFDPMRKNLNGTDLKGYYLYDDEGVKAQRVKVVENGILKNFLMSRTPLENFQHSNGHGRAQAGIKTMSRQSNLIVTTTAPHTDAQLRELLIRECKNQNKEYAYLFKEVVGGFTLTGRRTPNAFNVMPTVVYRVYADGRPDELVRGVNIIGTPLAMFAKISAVGDTAAIFNGVCGAESGSVPVSAVSPSLFVKQLEIQKKQQSDFVPTILSMPGANAKH
jgi:TldD protein